MVGVNTDVLRRNITSSQNSKRADVSEMVDQSKCEQPVYVEATNPSRLKWANHRMEAEASSAQLCEQLRLILEPTLASRMHGDYRTGKRINMRKVISYVSSGYRKDRIWLRRTKPAKRDYQVYCPPRPPSLLCGLLGCRDTYSFCSHI